MSIIIVGNSPKLLGKGMGKLIYEKLYYMLVNERTKWDALTRLVFV